MSDLGLGVMIGLLSGNEDSVQAFNASVNKTITALEIVDNQLLFTFEDNSQMALFDDGQSCCEDRYMNTDDDLETFIGSQLLSAEVREGPTKDIDYEEILGTLETEFLIVSTSTGQFTVVNYNEHNGYYGGFLISANTF